MDNTIVAAIIAAIAIVIAAVIGLLKFRAKSEERKNSDGDEILLVDIVGQNANAKNKKQNNKRDIPTFNRLQQFIDSNWIQNFESNQLANPEYVQVDITDDLHSYWNETKKSENEFSNQNLAEAHLVFVKAIKAFTNTVIRDTTFLRPESKVSVINSKAERHRKSSKDYHERYDREVKNITNKAKGIINAYKKYVLVARNESVYLQKN